MSFKPIHLNIAAAAILILLISGCGSSKTNFYVLTPIEKSSPLLDRKGTDHTLAIEISTLNLPAYLDRPQIVKHNSKNGLELDQFNQWAGKLDQNIARVMVKNLAQLLATPEVSMPPHRRIFKPDFRLEVDILKFEREVDDMVYLSAKWRIIDGDSTTVQASHISEMNSQHLSSQGYNGTVEAMSHLIGELSKQVAAEIIQLMQKGRPNA